MKKLLITTMAAVSVGLCAKAADAIDASTFTENGTSFDELTTGADFDGDNNFWQTPEGEGDLFKIIDVVYPEGATPQHWALATQEKALSIDTATPIFRNVNPVSDGNPPLDVSKKSVFFDSVVQFTATDVAPSMENNTTDKLTVWLYSSPDDVATTPGLFGETSPITRVAVTAGYSSDGANLITKHYLTNIEVEPDTWHRLTIKSFNDSADGDLLFNIWVDKTQVSGKETIEAQETTTDFLSRIPDSVNQDTFNTLQGVAFDGKGAVDDIVFTTTAPEFTKEPEAEKVNVSVTINDFAAIMMALFDGSEEITSGSASYEFEKGSTHNLQFMLNEGYELVSSSPIASNEDGLYTITVEPNSDVTIEIVVQKVGGGSGEEPEVPATPTIGGEGVKDADAFIAAANSGVTIKVPTDWTLDGNTLKDADGKEYATFADYYTVTLATDGTVTLELNDNAKPEIDETAADKGDAIVVTETEVALGVTNAKVGLWYGAQAYSDAACTTPLGVVTGWEQATGETVTVTVVKPDAGTAFFKVVVDDQDHTPATPPAEQE